MNKRKRGAPKKVGKEKKVFIAFYLNAWLVDIIEQIAEKNDTNRSQEIRNAIKRGLDV